MSSYPFRDKSLSLAERIEDLIRRLEPHEKISQLVHDAPAVERLGIRPYNWWNEALHGVARAGIATVFPQAIALGATFDTELIREVADTIAEEARAKYALAQNHGDYGIYKGLTFWSPNVNIFRDPRWGRGHETFGEDPYLSGVMGTSFIKGIQGEDPLKLKAAAAAKHFAVHSGPEKDRHEFDAVVSEKDLRETYLPAFEACVKEGRVEAVMGAYNSVNGTPCLANSYLMTDILRNEWGFEGHVVSDCCGLVDLHRHHHFTQSPFESAAIALKSGCDLNCGDTHLYLHMALEKGLVSEADIDKALKRVLAARFKLGMFDDEIESVDISSLLGAIGNEKARELAVKAAERSMVLLKNEGKLLPLDRDSYKTIGVIGPNANDTKVLLGNYHGTPPVGVSVLDGIKQQLEGRAKVLYSEGCRMIDPPEDCLYDDRDLYFSEAKSVAAASDIVIMVMGLSPLVEGEQGDASNSDASGDRLHLGLPGQQERLLKEIHAMGKKMVLVLINGGPLSIPWADRNVDAILEAWYPGGEGGRAVANILFGNSVPSGKLPMTVVPSIEDLPPFEDYSMTNRTYRYFKGTPQYPFGYGLTYGNVGLDDVYCDKSVYIKNEIIEVTGRMINDSQWRQNETIQIYYRYTLEGLELPSYQLCQIVKVALEPNESKDISVHVPVEKLTYVDQNGKRQQATGALELYVGTQSPCDRSKALTGREVACLSIEIKE